MIYYDNAATTKPCTMVKLANARYGSEKYMNPSAIYDGATEIAQLIDCARAKIAETLNAKPNEIYFTSGGTESNNWAIRSVAEMYKDKGKHIITSQIEHPSVLNTCKYLETHGYEVTYIAPNACGVINENDIQSAIRPDTILISIMGANNETGVVQPIGAICRLAHQYGILFHMDAVQLYGKMYLSSIGADLISASGHKFNGPKGVGFLYVKDGVKMCPLIYGGHQENGMRAGTENVPGIIGMGYTAELEYAQLEEHSAFLRIYKRKFVEELMEQIDDVDFNGDQYVQLPSHVSANFHVDANNLLVLLNENGICASAGSACNAGSNEPSHVLKAMGLSDKDARSTVRFSFGNDNDLNEIPEAVQIIKRCVNKLKMIGDPNEY